MLTREKIHGWETCAHQAHYRISTLAYMYGCSPACLRKFFLKHFDIDVTARLRALRYKRLRWLVAQGMTLKEICSDLGLKQVSYVSALVARVSGRGVRAYRACEKNLAASPHRDDGRIMKPSTATRSTHGASNGDDCIFFDGSGRREGFSGRRRKSGEDSKT